MIKLKEGFLLRTIAGRTVVVPTGDVLNLNLMISLNDTGRFLWTMLEKGSTPEALHKAMMETYDVSEEIARADVAEFIEKLSSNGFLED